jgi:hypothetical protein
MIDEWKLQEASADQRAAAEEIALAYDNFEDLNNTVQEVDESALDNLDFDFSLPDM